MPTTWSRPTRYLTAVGLLLFGIFLLYLSRAVLPLLVLAAVFSFLALPFINALHQRLRLPRGLAVLLTYLLGVLGLAVVLLLAVPSIVGAVQLVLNLDYNTLLIQTTDGIRGWLERLRVADIPFEPLDRAVENSVDALRDLLDGALPTIEGPPPDVALILQQAARVLAASFNLLAGLVGTVLSQAVTGFLVILLSLFISLDAHKLESRFLALFPAPYRPEMATLWARVQRVWHQFLRGQVTLMLLIGIVVWLGLTLLGLPYALPLGIVAGLLETIPTLGPILSTVPAIVVALLEGSSVLALSPVPFALLIVGFYVLVQQLENYIVVPRVLGEAVDLHPFVVMSGILIGASVGGVLGALLAAPLIASGREVVSYLYRKTLGQEPFPAEEDAPPTREHPARWRSIRALLARLRQRLQQSVSARESTR